MITVNKISKKRRTNQFGIIKFHLINKLIFEKNEDIIISDIMILSYLAACGKIELRKFCHDVARFLYPSCKVEDFAIKEQNIRNRVNKLEKRGFIIKANKHNKVIILNPEYDLDPVNHNTMYEYFLLYV